MIPSEDIDVDDGGDDVDFSDQMTPTVRKPELYELFMIIWAMVVTTRLLVIKKGVNGVESSYYFVAKHLRGPVSAGMRDVMVIPWWSYRDRRWFLWIMTVSPGNSWYESFLPLLRQPEDFYEGKAFTVRSDRDNARYRIQRHEAPSKPPARPGRSTNLMLTQALGIKGYIQDATHPEYARLISGEDLV